MSLQAKSNMHGFSDYNVYLLRTTRTI